jgi:hypothetical protein
MVRIGSESSSQTRGARLSEHLLTTESNIASAHYSLLATTVIPAKYPDYKTTLDFTGRWVSRWSARL